MLNGNEDKKMNDEILNYIELGVRGALIYNIHNDRISCMSLIDNGRELCVSWFDRWDDKCYNTIFSQDAEGIYRLRLGGPFINHLIKYCGSPLLSDSVFTPVYNSNSGWNNAYVASVSGLLMENDVNPEWVEDISKFSSCELNHDGREVLNHIVHHRDGTHTWLVDKRVL